MSKSRNLSDLLDANGDVKASSLDNVTIPSTLQDITDNGATSTDTITVGGLHVDSTGAAEMPAGTQAQRPTGVAGMARFNTDTSYFEFYNGTAWYPSLPPVPEIAYSSGSIVAGASSTLVLSGTNLGTTAGTANFLQASDSIDVDVTTSVPSGGLVSVTVPSSVYSNVTAGNTVIVSFTSEFGQGSNAINVTALALPTGGSITTSGSYRIHTFTGSSTFTTNFDLSDVEYLIVAGGGGGGSFYSVPGGGGAGGYRCSVSGESSGGGASAESPFSSVSAGSYTVTVGGGGAGAPYNGGASNGGNSTFNGITSIGGGRGATYSSNAMPQSGGSGGGAYENNLNVGSGTTGQGYAGGVGGPNIGGGGGGAGAAGSPGAGGNGVSSSINGSATYRAGGGGGMYNTSGTSTGGLGGGGKGKDSGSAGVSGTANTGGGGGGGDATSPAGGSGIVIIRYQL